MEELYIVYNQRACLDGDLDDTKIFKKNKTAAEYCKRLCIDKHIRVTPLLKTWNWFGLDVNDYNTQLKLHKLFGDEKVTTRIMRNINGSTIETYATLISIDTEGASDETLMKFLNICRRYGQYHIERVFIE